MGVRSDVAKLRRASGFGQGAGKRARLVFDAGAAVGHDPDRGTLNFGWAMRRRLSVCRHARPRDAARAAEGSGLTPAEVLAATRGAAP